MTERFAVLKFYQFIQPDGYILQFYTDRKCRLFLRESDVEPVTHMEPALRRGLIMHTDPRFCFVSWTMLPQQEEGETIIHSFYYRQVPLSERFWFYLVGEIDGVSSPSTSPIFHLPLNPVLPVETKYQLAGSRLYTSITWTNPYSYSFKCPTETKLSGFQLPIGGLNQPGRVVFRLYDTEGAWHKPRNILRQTSIPLVPEKRLPPNYGELYFPIWPIELTPGEYYAISLWGDQFQPLTPTIAWEWNNLEKIDPTEYVWRGLWLEGVFNWYLYLTGYFGYRSWWNIPFYQPGRPTPLQIPA